MRSKSSARLFALLSIALVSFAIYPLSAKAEGNTISVGVKGMTCGFCTRGIRKRFEKLPAVESASPNLDKERVELKLREDQDITDEQIKKVVDDSGYELTSIERQKSDTIPKPAPVF
jgi:mercuric ion binding protein